MAMATYYRSFIIFIFVSCCFAFLLALENEEENVNSERYKIEGRVVRPDNSLVSPQEWFANTQVYTSTGLIGFLREDGAFTIYNVPWGSHVVHVISPTFQFESVRIDVSSKGKIRARAINHIQPSKVDLMAYPLRLKSLGRIKYYQQREQWRVTDFLFNPMVLMTVLPLAFLMILPRLSDAETRKEMEQFQMPKMETREVSEIITSMFGGGGSGSSTNSQQRSKVRPGRRKDK